jgi:hypothetical protein
MMSINALLVGTDMGYLARIAGRLSREGVSVIVTADRDGLATALETEELSLVLCDLKDPGDLQHWIPGLAEYPGPLLFMSDLNLTAESFGGLNPVEVLPRIVDLEALVERVRQLEGA